MIRKRQQMDNFNELPKEKRPPEKLAWDGSAEEIEDWFDKVFDHKKSQSDEIIFFEDEIEG